ncbi:hypothetical protein EDD15DRAFT_2330402 [Pisolithus albus]|nr:hypothetical protein EDD15DRAFT_2330402 [Pisolithus albus]
MFTCRRVLLIVLCPRHAVERMVISWITDKCPTPSSCLRFCNEAVSFCIRGTRNLHQRLSARFRKHDHMHPATTTTR